MGGGRERERLAGRQSMGTRERDLLIALQSIGTSLYGDIFLLEGEFASEKYKDALRVVVFDAILVGAVKAHNSNFRLALRTASLLHDLF